MRWAVEINVLVERVEGNGYRATTYSPFPASADGPTSEEALSRLRRTVREKIAQGARLVKLDVTPEEHPIFRTIGGWKDDPTFEDFLQEVKRYRESEPAE